LGFDATHTAHAAKPGTWGGYRSSPSGNLDLGGLLLKSNQQHDPGGNQKSNLEPLLFGRKAASILLSVSIRTIDYALSRQEFEVRKVGRRKLITNRSLKSWANRNHYGSVRDLNQDKKDDQDGDKAA